MSDTALVVPLSLGAAVSPTVLTISVLVLSGERDPRRRAWAYALGVSLVAAAVIAVLATVGRNVQLGSSDPDATSRVVHGVLALVLALLGVRALMRPPPDHPSRLAERMDTAGPRFFLETGAVTMALNFSTLVMVVGAVHDITSSDDPASLVLLVLPFLGSVAPAVLPPLFVTVLGRRADPGLHRLNELVTTHKAQINAGICFLFAALLGIVALR